MFLWFLVLPITSNWMSPVLVETSGFEGYITLFLLILGICFPSFFFLRRTYYASGCQWGATQELLGYANPKSLDPRRKNKRKKIKYMLFIIWMVILVLGSILNIGYTFSSSPY